MRLYLSALAALLAASQIANAAEPERVLAQDEALAVAGAGLTAPVDWTVQSDRGVMTLTAPEGDLRLIVIDDTTESEAAAAVRAGWLRVGVTAPEPKQIQDWPANDGWDGMRGFEYDLPPEAKRILYASAQRKGDRWFVVLVDGAQGTLAKRSAAVDQAMSSFRPSDFVRESFAGKPAKTLTAADVEALKGFLATSMEQLGIPGAGFGLVQNGQTLFLDGMGVRELGQPATVDADTLFMVASNTKGMTTLMLATLVDEGKISWDQPVIELLPEFRLGDAQTTAQVQVRHLVCACTGLPRKDLDWIFNTPRDTKPDTAFTLLAETRPTSGFGEIFQYSNLMTTAGGWLGGRVAHPGMETGAAYDRAMKERVFAPLGMDRTLLSFADAIKDTNRAAPHGFGLDGKPATSELDLSWSVQPYRPAGGAWSTTRDLLRYAADELNQGVTPTGQRIVSAQNLLERRKRGVKEGEDAYYGIGISEDNRSGVSVYHHGGAMPGHMSDWVVIPEANLAAVILTNGDSGRMLLQPFRRRLLETLYGGKAEAEPEVKALADQLQSSIAEARKDLILPVSGAQADGLAAAYRSAELGAWQVERSADAVRFRFTDWASDVALKRETDGSTSWITISPSIQGFAFVPATVDGKRALKLIDAQHEYVFLEE